MVTRPLLAPEGRWRGAYGFVRVACRARIAVRGRGSGPGPEHRRARRVAVEHLPEEQPRRSLAQRRQVAAALPAGRRARLRHRRQPRDRARQRRDLLQQLHSDGRPGRLRPVGEHADGRRQRRLEGAERQHRSRRPLHAVGRLPRRLRAVAQHHSLRQHPHRRRARDAARRQYDRIHQRPLHALQKLRRHAALVVLERGDRDPRPAGRDHHLPGCAVRAVRRAGPLHPLLPARRPVGEAQVRLPDAGVRRVRDARLRHDGAVLFRAGAQLRLHVLPHVHLAPGRAVAGQLAPPARQRPVLRDAGGHRPGCRRSALGHHQPRSVRGLARQHRDARACSRCRAGGSSGGTSRSRATTRSAASTSSTTSC